MDDLVGRAGVADVFAGIVGERSGRTGIARIRPDGSIVNVWDRSVAYVR